MRPARRIAFAAVGVAAALASACELDHRTLSVQDAGNTGAAGFEDMPASVGRAGGPGITPPTGLTGTTGSTGAAGTTATGAAGAAGITGAAGTMGAAGAAGAPGPAVPGPPRDVDASTVSLVTTLAGSGDAAFADGTGAQASFTGVGGIALDAAGNVYVASDNRIRKVTPAGVVTTFAGSGDAAFADGTGAQASFNGPMGVAMDATGNLYVADYGNHRIRKVTPAGVVTTFAGANDPTFSPVGIAVDSAGTVYVTDGNTETVLKVSPAGAITLLAGGSDAGTAVGTGADGTGPNANFDYPDGIAVDATGNVYVGDGNRIRKVTPAGVVTTVAGSDPQGCPDFCSFTGLTIDAAGNLYVAYFPGGNNGGETTEDTLRKVTPAGAVTKLVGWGEGPAGFADGVGLRALFDSVFGLAVDAAGNVYVGDGGNSRIRKVRPIGVGELAVVWSPPDTEGGSPITGYTASARAPGQPTRTCATTGATSCIISGLTAGFAYDVTVTATNALGTSVPSTDVGAGLGFDGSAIAGVVPTTGCFVAALHAPGMTVRGTIQTAGTKAADCSDSKCGAWSYEREYFVTLPLGYDEHKAYPLVFQGPRCGGTGKDNYPLDLDGDVTKPNVDDSVIRIGLTPPPMDVGYPVANSHGCFDEHEGDDSVEWAFYENLYDRLANEVCFDRNRVFVSGDSNPPASSSPGGGGWWANELGCKYAGDPARPVRGVLVSGGELPTDAKYAPTCTSKPMAGMWVLGGTTQKPAPSSRVAITRAMKINGCTLGTGFDDATLASFPIGGSNADDTCKRIVGCPDLTPLVVCAFNEDVEHVTTNVVNAGFSKLLKLLEK